MMNEAHSREQREKQTQCMCASPGDFPCVLRVAQVQKAVYMCVTVHFWGCGILHANVYHMHSVPAWAPVAQHARESTDKDGFSYEEVLFASWN